MHRCSRYYSNPIEAKSKLRKGCGSCRASGVVVEHKCSPTPLADCSRWSHSGEAIRRFKRVIMENVKKGQRKAGRPVKAIKKEIRACVRFTHHEYFIVREKAKQAGINTSEYIRQTTIRGRVNPRLTIEESQIVRQLIGMAVNLNQVAKISHKEGLLKAMLYFEEYRTQIDQLIMKLKS